MLKPNPQWAPIFADLMQTKVFRKLTKKLDERLKKGAVIYPKAEQVFRAFDFFSPSQTKVVMLGQDPYHGPGQANGLAFSVHLAKPMAWRFLSTVDRYCLRVYVIFLLNSKMI
jgi:uracil-DNA glycosylase